jgi:hypothetical protein
VKSKQKSGKSKEKSGKSKLNNSEIQTIMRRNPNKKAFFYCLDFTDFIFGFPGFLF